MSEKHCGRFECDCPEPLGDNTFTVAWSPDDMEYVATHSSFPSMSWLDADPVSALQGLVGMMISDGSLEP